jgi:hypothetical protein
LFIRKSLPDEQWSLVFLYDIVKLLAVHGDDKGI